MEVLGTIPSTLKFFNRGFVMSLWSKMDMTVENIETFIACELFSCGTSRVVCRALVVALLAIVFTI